MALMCYYLDENEGVLSGHRLLDTAAGRLSLAVQVSGLGADSIKDTIKHFDAFGELSIEAAGTRGAAASANTRSQVPAIVSREALATYVTDKVVDFDTPVWVTRKAVHTFLWSATGSRRPRSPGQRGRKVQARRHGANG